MKKNAGRRPSAERGVSAGISTGVEASVVSDGVVEEPVVMEGISSCRLRMGLLEARRRLDIEGASLAEAVEWVEGEELGNDTDGMGDP